MPKPDIDYSPGRYAVIGTSRDRRSPASGPYITRLILRKTEHFVHHTGRDRFDKSRVVATFETAGGAGALERKLNAIEGRYLDQIKTLRADMKLELEIGVFDEA